MPVSIKGSGGGSVTLTSGASATDTTLTLPNVTGTVLQSGTAVTVAQGGTGLTAPGTSGNVLTSNGTIWQSTAPVVSGGTVTSITAGTGLTGGTITSSGTIALNTTAGAVGTYAFLLFVTISLPSPLTFGSTVVTGTSAALYPCDTALSNVSAITSGQTWRCMGTVQSGNATMFVRVS